jgi:hypothetical protein
VASACHDPTIDPSHYDQSCTPANECVLTTSGNVCDRDCSLTSIAVFDGRVCGPFCDDVGAAINGSESVRISEDITALRSQCSVPDIDGCVHTGPPHAVCDHGRCRVVFDPLPPPP